jgi:predicted DNA-binding transcriptional regulator YafY
MDEYYRVPLTSAEALAAIAALRAVHALQEAGGLETEIEPGILRSAADRMAGEVPDFLSDQAEALAGSLAYALRAGPRAGGSGEEHDGPGDAPPFPTRRTRRLLEDAFEHDAPVEIEYFVQSRDDWTTRRVLISDVYEREGAWYLSGHCELRGDFRQFRLDHIRSVRLLDEDAEVRDPFNEM